MGKKQLLVWKQADFLVTVGFWRKTMLTNISFIFLQSTHTINPVLCYYLSLQYRTLGAPIPFRHNSTKAGTTHFLSPGT